MFKLLLTTDMNVREEEQAHQITLDGSDKTNLLIIYLHWAKILFARKTDQTPQEKTELFRKEKKEVLLS